VAAGLTTVVVMLIVLLPSAVAFTLAAAEAGALANKIKDGDLRQQLTALRTSFDLEMPFADELRYFEASFDAILADAAAGATARVEKSALENLNGALAEFRDQVATSSSAALAPTVEEIRATMTEAQNDLPGSISYRSHVFEAARQFQSFKLRLLGGERGEYWARLKELANPTREDLQRVGERIFAGAPDWFRSVGGATGSFTGKLLVGIVITVISLHFFLADGPVMVRTVMRLSPLDDRHEKELLVEFDRVSRAVVLATLLAAVVQGILAGIGFWLAGLGSVFLLAVLTTVFALIPFVGAATIWVPASLYLFFVEERTLAAALLAAYGAGIVSLSDNLIKPLVLHGQSNLHPLLALLSVLGGVHALGPIGVLVGPMVVVFLQTLLNILHRELIALEASESAVAATAEKE
jgi:predicted PurR-regulated permease PerM